MLTRFAVALTLDPLLNATVPATVWIEFYMAEDRDHAQEQAEDAHGPGAVLAVAHVLEDAI